jgi:hypothetical protein
VSPEGISRLIAEHEAEIRSTDQSVTALEDDLARLCTTRRDLLEELKALRQIARRRGLDPEPASGDEAPEEDWSGLTRVDAVERVLMEAPGSLTLSEMQAELHLHGRPNDPADAISGTLAHLKRARGTVVSSGRGRWRYNTQAPVATYLTHRTAAPASSRDR